MLRSRGEWEMLFGNVSRSEVGAIPEEEGVRSVICPVSSYLRALRVSHTTTYVFCTCTSARVQKRGHLSFPPSLSLSLSLCCLISERDRVYVERLLRVRRSALVAHEGTANATTRTTIPLKYSRREWWFFGNDPHDPSSLPRHCGPS